MGAISLDSWLAASTLVLCILCSDGAFTNGNAKSFVTNFCSPNSGNALGYVVLETKQHTTWTEDKFCQALADHPAYVGNYVLTLQLFNDIGYDKANRGYLGIAFNVKDSMNYDFIKFYVRPEPPCFTFGYMQYALHQIKSVNCLAPKPRIRTWFTVQVQVAEHSTRVFVDGVRARTFLHHHKTVARGGVVVPNGYRSQVFFRGYRIAPWVAGRSHPKASHCVSHHQTPEYSTLDATSGSWPGLCRVLLGPGVDGIKYRVSVDMNNVIGWQGINSGHPGVMYNVQDMNNFDFVYFRPHSTSECFQTGYILNGHLKNGAKGTCANGVPQGGRWFNIEVHVDGSSANIYKDGFLIYSAKSKFKPEGNGGVIVGTGFKNIVRYKNFRISA